MKCFSLFLAEPQNFFAFNLMNKLFLRTKVSTINYLNDDETENAWAELNFTLIFVFFSTSSLFQPFLVSDEFVMRSKQKRTYTKARGGVGVWCK